ncbi:MAG: hypothetical protein ACOY30_08575 [Bacillota bacterium]
MMAANMSGQRMMMPGMMNAATGTVVNQKSGAATGVPGAAAGQGEAGTALQSAGRLNQASEISRVQEGTILNQLL